MVAMGIVLVGLLTGTTAAQAQIPHLPDLIAMTSSPAEAYPVWFDGYKLFHIAVPSQSNEGEDVTVNPASE